MDIDQRVARLCLVKSQSGLSLDALELLSRGFDEEALDQFCKNASELSDLMAYLQQPGDHRR